MTKSPKGRKIAEVHDRAEFRLAVAVPLGMTKMQMKEHLQQALNQYQCRDVVDESISIKPFAKKHKLEFI